MKKITPTCIAISYSPIGFLCTLYCRYFTLPAAYINSVALFFTLNETDIILESFHFVVLKYIVLSHVLLSH